jgi:hypothetical protein
MNQNYRTFKKNHNLTVGGAPCTESIHNLTVGGAPCTESIHNLTVGGAPCTESIQFSKCVSGNTAELIKIS